MLIVIDSISNRYEIVRKDLLSVSDAEPVYDVAFQRNDGTFLTAFICMPVVRRNYLLRVSNAEPIYDVAFQRNDGTFLKPFICLGLNCREQRNSKWLCCQWILPTYTSLGATVRGCLRVLITEWLLERMLFHSQGRTPRPCTTIAMKLILYGSLRIVLFFSLVQLLQCWGSYVDCTKGVLKNYLTVPMPAQAAPLVGVSQYPILWLVLVRLRRPSATLCCCPDGIRHLKFRNVQLRPWWVLKNCRLRTVEYGVRTRRQPLFRLLFITTKSNTKSNKVIQ